MRLEAYGEGIELEQGVGVTRIPLECERTIEKSVEKCVLYLKITVVS